MCFKKIKPNTLSKPIRDVYHILINFKQNLVRQNMCIVKSEYENG